MNIIVTTIMYHNCVVWYAHIHIDTYHIHIGMYHSRCLLKYSTICPVLRRELLGIMVAWYSQKRDGGLWNSDCDPPFWGMCMLFFPELIWNRLILTMFPEIVESTMEGNLLSIVYFSWPLWKAELPRVGPDMWYLLSIIWFIQATTYWDTIVTYGYCWVYRIYV